MPGTETKVRLIHIPKQVRVFFKKALLMLLIFLSLFILILSKVENKSTLAIREKLINIIIPISEYIYYPFEKTSDFIEELNHLFHTYHENQSLKHENTHLKLNLIKMEEYRIENRELRKLLNFVEKYNNPFKTARIISNVGDIYNHKAYINLGSKDGIKKGQVVISYFGLVGRIIEVSKNKSSLNLITDINSRVPVISVNSRNKFIVAGNNNNILNVMYIDENAKIVDGEYLVTSADGGIFTRGIPVARIFKTQGKYYAIPIVGRHKIEYVSVLMNKENKDEK